MNDMEVSGTAYPILPECDESTDIGPKTCHLATGSEISGRFSSVNFVPAAPSSEEGA